MSLPIESSTACLVGWRGWQFLRPHFLVDINSISVLMPRQRGEAFCNWEKEHLVPDVDCSCGFYAHKTREQNEREYNFLKVRAEVYLWGKVIESTHGYRAQYIYPKRLFVLANSSLEPLAGYLSYIYGVEVVTEVDTQPEKTAPTPWNDNRITLEKLLTAAMSEELDISTRRYALMQARTRLNGRRTRQLEATVRAQRLYDRKTAEGVQTENLLRALKELRTELGPTR